MHVVFVLDAQGWNLQPCSILRQIKFFVLVCRLFVADTNLICLLFEFVLIFSDDDNNGHFMSAELNLSGEN